MATNNKPVTAYLPSEILEYLTEYCKSNGLIRKDKLGNDTPAMGTAVTNILTTFFKGNVPSEIPSNTPAINSELTERIDNLEGLINGLFESSSRLGDEIKISEKKLLERLASINARLNDHSSGNFQEFKLIDERLGNLEGAIANKTAIATTPETNPKIYSEKDLKRLSIKQMQPIIDRLCNANPEAKILVRDRRYAQKCIDFILKWQNPPTN